jgi:hypothetical protein
MTLAGLTNWIRAGKNSKEPAGQGTVCPENVNDWGRRIVLLKDNSPFSLLVY